MAFSTPWQLSDIRNSQRRELLDLSARWWSNSELDQYTNDWLAILQSQFEFVWTTTTYTMSSTTASGGGWGQAVWGNDSFGQPVILDASISPILSLSNFPTMLRLDAVYFSPGGTNTSIHRLSPRSIEDLDRLQMDWRAETPLLQPELVFQPDAEHVQFWPPPPGSGTYIFEYPVILVLATDTSTLQLPPWTRHDAVAYGAYRALSRFGPNQDLTRASRYRRRHETNLRRFRRTYDAYFPEHAPALRPGARWAGQITQPRQNRYVPPGGGL